MQEQDNGESEDWNSKREGLSKKEKRRSGGFWTAKKPLKASSKGGSGFLSFRRKEVNDGNGTNGKERVSPPSSTNKVPKEKVSPPSSATKVPPIVPARTKGGTGRESDFSPRDSLENLNQVKPTPVPSVEEKSPPVPHKKPPVPKKPLPPVKKLPPRPPSKTEEPEKPKKPTKEEEKPHKEPEDAKAWRIHRGRSFGRKRTESSEKTPKKNRSHNSTDDKLGEALIDAAMLGKPEDLTRLLDLGADTQFVDSNGYTAAHWAASNGHAACLSLLIERGANINAVDYLNWTPLHYAVFSGQQTKSKTHVRVIELLVAAGADTEKKNNKGKKAVDLTNNKTVLAMLKKKRTSSSVSSAASKVNGLFKRKSRNTDTSKTATQPSKGKQTAKVTDPTKTKDPETDAFYEKQLQAIAKWEELIKARERALWSKEEELYAVEKGLKMDVIKLKRVVEEDRAREATYKKRLEEVEKFEQMKKEKQHLLLEKQREKLVNSVDYDELILQDCLGGGASAKVYKANWREDVVAVKQIAFDDPLVTQETAVAAFQMETVLLGRMRHLNIVLLMGVCVHPPNLCLIMEQMTRGDLFSLLHRQKENIVPWDLRLQITLDIARGMNYLHRMVPPMIHRDLKSKNILLDDTFRAKLADFGTTRIKQETLLHTSSNIGTPAWMAPECLRGEDFDERSDIYSFGIVLYEIMERKVPWENRDPVQIIGAVGFGKERPPLPAAVPYGCPEGFLNLIQCCWAHDQKERPSFGHILPYLRTWIQESASVF